MRSLLGRSVPGFVSPNLPSPGVRTPGDADVQDVSGDVDVGATGTTQIGSASGDRVTVAGVTFANEPATDFEYNVIVGGVPVYDSPLAATDGDRTDFAVVSEPDVSVEIEITTAGSAGTASFSVVAVGEDQ